MQGFGGAKSGGANDPLKVGVDDVDRDLEEADDNDTAKSLEAFVDGKLMTVVMTLLTIFALWGDNMRVAFFDKDADNVFYVLFAFALFMFFLEFFINTVAKPEYKWGFFFVLDLISAVSIIPDIPWIMSALAYIMNGTSEGVGTSSTGGLDKARTARIVRLVRLIRLIRIVKLYSMVSKAQDADQEEKLKAQARAAQNAKQAALKRIEASRLGRALSELTTRRVIVGVLLMLFIMPLLQNSETNEAFYTGLSQLYWFGRSRCDTASENASFGCDGQIQKAGSSWIEEDGWKNMLWIYSRSGFRAKYYPTDEGVPDYLNDGRLRDVRPTNNFNLRAYVILTSRSYLSTRNLVRGIRRKAVQGFNCHLIARSSDHDSVMLAETPGCDKAIAYARFETKSLQQTSNALDMISTLFVCILLGTLSIQFQNDTQKLVIGPIEKMVNIIKQLAEDPLRKREVQDTEVHHPSDKMEQQSLSMSPHFEEDDTSAGPQLETRMLENTILKIGMLLQVGFGTAGAEIVGNSMKRGDGELNIMMPGRCILGIFAYVGINRLASLADSYGQDVTVLVNKVAKIIHGCAKHWYVTFGSGS
ncbi:conserved hypothetical protein [Perkinsus marinus ATCC 50983]|uniref:Ion transport domain-containing protein n=1 Tax=Perkinsus marinus (strain ATCC 50983 / TXsc) TaxID=423536 RepID=C5KTB1_PERM5|nr:conserved hypothetical protein [Perkinsus marinus ATCC 50983]EER12216.1 conserved hypothetical protein [Perkinsus marinus ATCC 50983]|eukprot:XP_002780421.1 conserved hypothetical protein [Perkinsus marinus ATCC 50983]